MEENNSKPEEEITPEEQEEIKEESEKHRKYREQVEGVEKIVNQYVRDKLLPGTGLKPYHVYIHLVIDKIDKRGIAWVHGGQQAQIYLAWPDAFEEFNTIVGRNLAYIVARKLVTPTEVQTVAYMQQNKKNMREFLRKEFGDLSEIVADIIPLSRIRIKRHVVRSITMVDTLTGISATVESSDPTETEYALEQKARVALSRKVKDNESTGI